MTKTPELAEVIEWDRYLDMQRDHAASAQAMLEEATRFLEFYDWCHAIQTRYVGMFYPGVVAVFLFKIVPATDDVDEWIWVVVGDLPPAYITTDQCPDPPAALDGYIGAMQEWVAAARMGKSVAQLVPVNVPATKDNAEKLHSRLEFLDMRVLSRYPKDPEV